MNSRLFSPQHTPGLSPRHPGGFSLVELLVVLGILGVIVSIAISHITRISGGADEAHHRRNAQSLASTYLAGQTAGAHFLVLENLDLTIEKITNGVVIPNGVYAGVKFAVPGLDESERAGAARYLTLQNDRLLYNPNL